MNKYALNLIVSLFLFKAGALNAAPSVYQQPGKNRAYLEKQFSRSAAWNPCTTHYARYATPSAQTRCQPAWRPLYLNLVNAKPTQANAGTGANSGARSSQKPVKRQVFQNEPALPLSKYKEAERKSFWWAAGAGSVSSIAVFLGLSKWIDGKGLLDIAIRLPVGAITSLGAGLGVYAITRHQAKNHYIKRFVSEQR